MPKRMGLLGPDRSEIGSRLLKPGLITFGRIYCCLAFTIQLDLGDCAPS
jgi:hypothetical protein